MCALGYDLVLSMVSIAVPGTTLCWQQHHDGALDVNDDRDLYDSRRFVSPEGLMSGVCELWVLE